MNKYLFVLYAFAFPVICLVLMLGVTYDRQVVVRQLVASEAENDRWRSMVDQIPGGVFRISAPDGVITYTNEGALRLTGFTTEELIGHKFTEFDVAPGKEMHKRMIADLRFHRDNVGHWIRRVGPVGHKDGEPRQRAIAIRPYFDISGARFWLVFMSPIAEPG